MNGEAVKEVERIVRDGHDAKTTVVEGRTYSVQALRPVVPPQDPTPRPLVVHTLSGLVGYLASHFDELKKVAVHIESEDLVTVCSPLEGHHRQRHDYARAAFAPVFEQQGGIAFGFGKWMDLETFVIGMQALVVGDDARDELLRILGNVKEEKVQGVADDGTSQTVSAKAGIALVDNLRVPNPVPLRPRRTFREIVQPASPFVVRLKAGNPGSLPAVSLWEADGGAWKLEAIEGIRRYLREYLDNLINERREMKLGTPAEEIPILA
jgi:hypothetical protein